MCQARVEPFTVPETDVLVDLSSVLHSLRGNRPLKPLNADNGGEVEDKGRIGLLIRLHKMGRAQGISDSEIDQFGNFLAGLSQENRDAFLEYIDADNTSESLAELCKIASMDADRRKTLLNGLGIKTGEEGGLLHEFLGPAKATAQEVKSVFDGLQTVRDYIETSLINPLKSLLGKRERQ